MKQSVVDDFTCVGEVPFRDRTASQLSSPAGETVLDELLRYWRKRLAEPLPVLQLPTDRPYPASLCYRLATHSFILPGTLIESLRSLAHAEQCTLFMLLLSTFKLLLYRYCDQENIIVGSPGPQRNRFGTGNHVLLFDNLLALHTDLSGNPSFRQLLRRVRETCLGAFTHHALPLGKLIEALYPERAPTGSALFRVVFALGGNLHQDLGIPGVEANQLDIDDRAAVFDLSLSFDREANGLRGVIGYNPDLFDSTTIDRMAGHLRVLLESAVSNPGQTIHVLSILSPEERRKILVDWNDTEADYPGDQCIHQLFESQVQRTPEAAAVAFEGQMLTYRELNRLANQLANYLTTLGVGPDTLVAICANRSPKMLIGLLGILKAGGAYVPLDPAYPAERLAFMLEDSCARVLLVQGNIQLAHHERNVPCCMVRLDADWPRIAQQSETNPACSTTHENLAYVIYTSGSMGRPKGTLIHHRGLVNYLTWCRRAYPLNAGSGAPVHSSISFDLTVTGLFGPLLVGGTVYLLPDGSGAETLAAALQARTDFSLIKITPSHLELLGRQLTPDEAAGRTRAFIIGGESLLPEHLAFWRRHAPDTLLINEYGPTETVVGCCVYSVPAGERLPRTVPIGRPISNTQLYVLDRHLQPTPIGVPGELHIGGAGVARGYLNQPKLTAEKFIPNPFSNEPGARLYKTGDLARYLADGNIEFIGRKDDQVKIRGYRIEPGEVEFVLKSHPLVIQAAAVVREDNVGEKQLVAYVVSRLQVPLSVDELRAYMLVKVPSFMVPSVFVQLNELPLNANGKTDRRSLPAPETQITREKQAGTAPRTATEKLLAGIWAELLKTEHIGMHDDFFEMGGHSLLATRIITRIRNALNIDLPLPLFFEIPTVAALSNWIDSNRC